MALDAGTMDASTTRSTNSTTSLLIDPLPAKTFRSPCCSAAVAQTLASGFARADLPTGLESTPVAATRPIDKTHTPARNESFTSLVDHVTTA